MKLLRSSVGGAEFECFLRAAGGGTDYRCRPMEFPDGAALAQSSWLPVDCRSGGIEVQADVHPEDELPKQQVPGCLPEASRSWEMKENGPSPPAQLQNPPAPRRRKGRGGLLPLDPVPAEQLSAGENGQNSGDIPDSSSLSPSRIARLDPTFPRLPEGLFQPLPPIDFAEVTSADLGIAAQSFTPRQEVKDKALLKARRRSTIGTRGSPETNYLIRHIARQRLLSKPSPVPKLSPFPSCSSALKHKMAAFRNSLYVVDENKALNPFAGAPTPSGNAEAWARVQEARPHSEPPSKRKKGGLLLDLEPSAEGEQLCENTGTPALLLLKREGALFTSGVPGITEQQEEEEEKPWETEGEGLCAGGGIPFPDLGDETEPLRTEAPLLPACTLQTPSCTGEPKRVRFGSALHPELFDQTLPPSTPLWRGESPGSLLKSAPCRAEQYLTDGHPDGCSLPQSPERGSDSVLLPDPSVESDAAAAVEGPAQPPPTDAAPGGARTPGRKRVRFGGLLSPELFDRTLPPNTPLCRGQTPACLTPSAGSRPRSVLKKTPLKSEGPPPQPDFDSPRDCVTVIRFPDAGTLDETRVEFHLQLPAEHPGVQPATPVVPVSEEGPPESQPPIAEQDCEILRNSPQARPGMESVRRSGRKRKQSEPEQPCPVRKEPRAKRRGATGASAPRKLEVVRGKGRRGRRGGKPVDRSLYVGRDYASKPPALSPITEDLHSAACTPATPTHQGALQGLAEEEAATGSQRDPENEENVPPSSPVLVKRRKPAPKRGEGDPNTAAPLETTATSPEVILQAQETVHPPAARGGESSPPTRNGLDPKQGCGSEGGGAEIGKPAVRRGRRSAGVKKPLALSENGQPGTAASGSLQGEVLETAEPREEEREGERASSSPAQGRKSVGGARRGRRSAVWQPEGHCHRPTQDSTPQEHTLAPGLSDFSIEDVLAAPHPSLAVRRSMRNRRDSGATGLGWVPKGSPSPSTVLKRRGRRRSSFGVPLRTECSLQQTGSPGEGGCNTAV
ncbi:cell division cycle-associated protein 2 isoform X1 [Acipenser ruthenus]|uniref:cell division cycle-associated protein 2 isoform X1 n=2 Tax=Acipenser ruthenus TaxID=7906 RepID=UPI0027417FE9|nr:cell division cycle-associated protein 2 isoform X1 [Acipenser ruthenus]